MHRNRNAVLAMCALAGIAFPAFGQDEIGSAKTARPVPHPFTAKYQITSEQTLANGTTITQESTQIVAMDSQGRRLVVTSLPATDQIPERTVVRVDDPAAGTNTTWMVPGKSATVRQISPRPEQGHAATTCWTAGTPQGTKVPLSPDHADGAVTASVGDASIVPPQRKRVTTETAKENLGTQTIQGLLATGTRMTWTIRTGAEGNDAPLVRVVDIWDAESIPLIVREVTDDPRTGKRDRELTELSQSETDPATFQPPEGYEVVTEETHAAPCQ